MTGRAAKGVDVAGERFGTYCSADDLSPDERALYDDILALHCRAADAGKADLAFHLEVCSKLMLIQHPARPDGGITSH